MIDTFTEIKRVYDLCYGRKIAQRHEGRAQAHLLGIEVYELEQRLHELAMQIRDASNEPPEIIGDYGKFDASYYGFEQENDQVVQTQYLEDPSAVVHDSAIWLTYDTVPDSAALAWPKHETLPISPGLKCILELSLDREELAFLKLESKGTIRICVNSAAPMDQCLTRVDLKGSASWIDPPDELEPADPDLEYVMTMYLRPGIVPSSTLTYESVPKAEDEYDADLSYVGGTPHWQQDPDYPICPECGKPMIFVGQVATCVGVYTYCFLCEDCLTAVSMQQGD